MLIRRNGAICWATTYLVLVTAVVLLMSPTRNASAAEQVRIGFINPDRVAMAVLKQTPEYEVLRKELEKRRAELEMRREEINKLKEDLEANRVIWNETKNQEQEKLIRDKFDDLKVFSESAQRYGDAEYRKIERRLVPEIMEAVKKVGEREGYSMIFDRRILLYGSPNFDLTDAVIKEMSEASGD